MAIWLLFRINPGVIWSRIQAGTCISVNKIRRKGERCGRCDSMISFNTFGYTYENDIVITLFYPIHAIFRFYFSFRIDCSVVIQFRFICVLCVFCVCVCFFVCDVSLINDDLVCVRVFVQKVLFNLETTPEKKYNRRTQLESQILHA